MESRVRTETLPLPGATFGPMRFLDALPWLVLAAAMRVIAFGGGVVGLFAMLIASIAVLQAFIAVTKRSIELSGGTSGLDGLVLHEEFQLSVRILWRIGALMLGATAVMAGLVPDPVERHMFGGLDGMAFDQINLIGKPWSALIAALVLLLIVGAEKHAGRVSLKEAMRELVARLPSLGLAILVLTAAYFALAFGQGAVRSAIWTFWQTSAASQFTKNLVFFVFIFSFAMLRLWVILTWGLKRSFARSQG